MSTAQTSSEPAREIRVRKPIFRFADVPRHWLFGRAVPTHLANAMNLLFPLGERFFIRSVRRFADRIDDPVLREQVQKFMAQEVRHGMEHERFFETLERQGFEIRSFLAWYERVAYGIIEKNAPAELNLSVTVALEHFTAMFADRALRQGLLDDHAHPAMRDLLLWHACEEIEHKAVAYDVLAKVNPSWALRAAGISLAAMAFVTFWLLGTRHLLRQEKDLKVPTLDELRDNARYNTLLNGEFVKAFVEYLRPGFHPSQQDNYRLAREWIAKNEERLGIAA